MGNKVSAKILLLGLDEAGKTRISSYMENGPNSTETAPSQGFETREIKFKHVLLNVFDPAGGDKVRDLWRHYYEGTDGIVWVVDSSDESRFEESKDALQLALGDGMMKRDVPVFVACNKCDKDGAVGDDKITQALDLANNLQGREFLVKPTNAATGEGINTGFEFLSKQIKAEYKRKKKEGK